MIAPVRRMTQPTGLVSKNAPNALIVAQILAVRTSKEIATAPLEVIRPRSVKSFAFSSALKLDVAMRLRNLAAVFASVDKVSSPSAVVDIIVFNNACFFAIDKPDVSIACFTSAAFRASTAVISPVIAAIFAKIAFFKVPHTSGKNIFPNLNAEIVINIEGINPRVSTSLINAVPKLTIILMISEPSALFHII